MIDNEKTTLEVITELRRALMISLERVPADSVLRRYPPLVKSFRENATLLRDLVQGLQDACLQGEQPIQDSRSLGRKERLGLDRYQGSW